MDLSLSWQLWLYQLINFLLLTAILGFILNKYIRPFLRKRAENIQKSFEEIEKGKQEIEGLKKDYQAQLDHIKEKSREEINRAVIEGNQLREGIVTKADKDAMDIVEKARHEIEHEKNRALSEVRNSVVSLSMSAARHLIKKEIDEKANKKLVEDFIDDLQKQQQVFKK
jgi:F-type H+-transporting ATPase subunit b